jgi:mannose-6-phosphate isomerase-like protein (cupin superfamily)
MSELITHQGKHFAQMETGSLKEWPNYTISLPDLDFPGKLFIKDTIGLTGCEISINSMKPGDTMPFDHTHQQNEEVYIFIQGQGQMLIDGETLDVKEGSIVRIDPAAKRAWRNNSDGQMVYIIIQVKKDSLEQYSLTDGLIMEGVSNW